MHRVRCARERGHAFEEVCSPSEYVKGSDTARARIAACAPEALRMLLANGCPDEWHAKDVGTGCPDSCPWLALMRKAGVRE